MTWQEIDFIFPFIVFFYGTLMTLTLNLPQLVKLAEQRFPRQLIQQMNSHRTLGIICFYVGGLWSLQNIWHSSF